MATNTTNKATTTTKATNKGVTNMANTTTNKATTNNATKATATKPAKVNTLNTVATVLGGISGVTFTHNARNITVSSKATGKKLFEVWRRAQAIRLYVPAPLVATGKKLKGAYNVATGFNGYPQGTYSIYIPLANVNDAIVALTKAGLALPAPAPKTKATKGAPAPATATASK